MDLRHYDGESRVITRFLLLWPKKIRGETRDLCWVRIYQTAAYQVGWCDSDWIDYRVVTRFLLWPKTIEGETRHLRWVQIGKVWSKESGWSDYEWVGK